MEQDFRRYCRSQLTFVLLPEFIVPAALLPASAISKALEGADGPMEQIGTSVGVISLQGQDGVVTESCTQPNNQKSQTSELTTRTTPIFAKCIRNDAAGFSPAYNATLHSDGSDVL